VTPSRTCARFAATILYAAISRCHTVASEGPERCPSNSVGWVRNCVDMFHPRLHYMERQCSAAFGGVDPRMHATPPSPPLTAIRRQSQPV
jgi:hypothetical protein